MLASNQLDEALTILQKEIAPISSRLDDSLIHISAGLSSLKLEEIDGTITPQELLARQAGIRRQMQALLKLVPNELKTKKILAQHSALYTMTADINLEKIQGRKNNIVPMSWIYKAKEVSKSVCQVIRNDGKKGSGWLLDGGWMMTNYHVVPSAEWA